MAKTKTKTTTVGEAVVEPPTKKAKYRCERIAHDDPRNPKYQKAQRAMKKKAKQAMRKTTKAKRAMRKTQLTQDEEDPFVKKSELDDARSEMIERELGCYESDDLQQAMLDDLQIIVKGMVEDLTDQGFKFRPCVAAYVQAPNGLQVPIGPKKHSVTGGPSSSSCGPACRPDCGD